MIKTKVFFLESRLFFSLSGLFENFSDCSRSFWTAGLPKEAKISVGLFWYETRKLERWGLRAKPPAAGGTGIWRKGVVARGSGGKRLEIFNFLKITHFGIRYTLFIFIRTILQEHEAHFCSEFKNNPSLSRRTRSTICKVHFASCLFMFSCSSQLHKHKQKFHTAYLTSWNNSIFGYKLRTIEVEISYKVKNSQP